MRHFITTVILALLLAGCSMGPSIDDGSYLRVSRGSFGAKFLQWLGLAAEGQYCQISSNEIDYEWTTADLRFFKDQCPDSDPLADLRKLIEDSRG